MPHAAEGILLNAARARHAWLSLPRITCNHFDMDGLVAVYAALEPEAALRHERLLRACSHLGDFREQLEPADAALCAQATLLCAWVSALERSLFYAPFRGSEALGAAKKYAHFLPRLPAALALAAACEGEETALPASCVLREHDSVLKSELKQVRSDTEALARVPEAVTLMPKLGLAVVRAPRPVHYQALFGAGRGCEAPWCPFCQKMEAALEAVAKGAPAGLAVCKLRGDEHRDFVREHLQTSSFPTILALRAGARGLGEAVKYASEAREPADLLAFAQGATK